MQFVRKHNASHHRRLEGPSRLSFADFLFTSEEESLSQIVSSTIDDTMMGEDDSTVTELFGSLRGNVVGLRYYNGVVNKNEMVALVREPNNPHDSNAIQVNNIYGDKVGHIKRELAVPLAFIMDNNLAKIEGIVPFGVTNSFTMPVNLQFWGKTENRSAVIDKLNRHGYKLAPSSKLPASASNSYWSSMAFSPGKPKLAAVQITNEQLKNEFDKLFENLTEDKAKEMEPADAIGTPLLPHQKQALAWMVTQENSNDLPPFWEQKNNMYYNLLTNFAVRDKPTQVPGGLLSDEMGLGKTLSTIAVIVTNFHNGKPLPVKIKKEHLKKDKSPDWAAPPGLRLEKDKSKNVKVRSEGDKIKLKAAKAGSHSKREKSMVYITDSEDDGDDECPTKKMKSKVKTGKSEQCSKTGSFSQLMDDSEFATALQGTSSALTAKRISKTKGGGNSIKPSLKHNDIDINTRATLIICPLSVISNWLDQFEQHIRPEVNLNVYVYHGSERKRDPAFLSKQDVVLTTYNVITVDFTSGNASPLHQVNWLRVVLDEGHVIRNPGAFQTKAVLELKAIRRWILTGTPIQNSLKDIWPLVCFLKLKPFEVKEWWNRTIQRPVMLGDQEGLRRLQALLKSITLRRTKSTKIKGCPVVDLPERKVFVQHVVLSEEEKQIYESIKNESRTVIGRYFNEGTVLTNYADVLVILLRLRQLCCHPLLLGSSTNTNVSTGDATPLELRDSLINKMNLVLSSGSDEECAICLDSLRLPVITYCAHVYCKLCICQVIRTEKNAKCPLCRADININEIVEFPEEKSEAESEIKSKWLPSSKVDALMHELLKLRNEDPGVKSLVVSQFTAFLSLIEIPLRNAGFIFTRFDGSLSQSKRTTAIKSFQSSHPGSPTVMLLSLKAGGVGLNLTAASRVFLMDPAWNPAAEDQCFDRCHRLGQMKEVIITKFIVKDTVEENMMKMQEKKRDLATRALANKTSQGRQARIEEIKTLMDL
ncbi:helicase-like transcription factor isoform X1 [Erpetoichthys calabaricus]|uniref:helicase-like transcription factor isoform X1 n=2 Tax=Erpetoichthys calabaricus TaxID=27687 RepID=UPI00223426CB|nr:helicase-like transcription factor isoform X1 [Erpetoichthys calabaricus]